jgi:hypothetical protein
MIAVGLICFLLGVLVCYVGMSITWFDTQPELVLVERGQQHIYGTQLTVRRGDEEPFTVIGSSSVWHFFPSGQRCGGDLEHELAVLYKRIEWGVVDKRTR